MDLPTSADLKERREELGLTQAELAASADVSQPLIARIEGGDVDPRLSTLRRIVNALKQAQGEVVRAADLMNEDIVSVATTDTVRDAATEMSEKAYSQLPVVQDGVPVGSISTSDLSELPESARDDPIADHMAESFPTVSPEATLDVVQSYLEHATAVMVTDDGRTVGLITDADVAARLS
mgnify:CR=1 FL=1